MEKYKIIVLVERIKKCLEEGKLQEALTLAEGIDKKKLKNMSDLCVIAECYFQNKQYEEAKKLFLKIYEKNKTRRIVAQLVHLCIKLEEPEEAEKYLAEFIRVAPRDFYRYIFRYSIDKLTHAPMAALIEDLENLKEHEYIESWAYELAKLYYKSGMKNECVKECDDIMLWFGNGEYVERAKALRAYYMGELTVENLKEKAEKAKDNAEKVKNDSEKVKDDAEKVIEASKESEIELKESENHSDEKMKDSDEEMKQSDDFDDISAFERALANSIQFDDKPADTLQKDSQESKEYEAEQEPVQEEEYEYVDYAGDDEYYEEDDLADETPEESDQYIKDDIENDLENEDEPSEELDELSDPNDIPLRLRKKVKDKKSSFPKKFGHFTRNLLRKMNLEQQDDDFDSEEEIDSENDVTEKESKEEIKHSDTLNDRIETDSDVNNDSNKTSDREYETELSECVNFEENAQETVTEVTEQEESVKASNEDENEQAELNEEITAESDISDEETKETEEFAKIQEPEEEEEVTESNGDTQEEYLEETQEETSEESEEEAENAGNEIPEAKEDNEDTYSGYAPHERLKIDLPSNDQLLMEEDSHLYNELEEYNIDLMSCFGNFMRIDPVREQLIVAMKQLMISRNDNVNLAIMGNESEENLLFAKKMAKFIYRFGCIRSKKVALISGERLNAIPVLERREQLKDCVLIVEHAGDMNQETIYALLRLNAYYPNGIAVILEDTSERIKKIFKDNASIHAIFDLQMIIPECTFDEYMGFAYDYICAKQYEIEAEAFEELERCLLSKFNQTEENKLKIVFSCLDEIIQNSEHRNAEQLKEVSVTGHYEETDFMVIRKEDVFVS